MDTDAALSDPLVSDPSEFLPVFPSVYDSFYAEPGSPPGHG